MATEFLWLLWVSGALALGSLVQLAVSWRRARMRLPKGGAGVVVFGSRICLVCWSYVLIARAAGTVGLLDHIPQKVTDVLAGLAYGAILAAAGGVLVSAIAAVAWLIRSAVQVARQA